MLRRHKHVVKLLLLLLLPIQGSRIPADAMIPYSAMQLPFDHPLDQALYLTRRGREN